jgi:aldose 1-epimerase
MAPYPNRIRDGRFSFAGISHQLRFPEKHAIHGDVRNRAWEVTESSATSIALQFDSRNFSDLNFPFPFSIEQSFDVADSALTINCILRNEGATAFPAGFGFHPYYNRALGENDENVALTFNARGAYPFSGEVPLPESMAAPLSASLDFSKSKAVPEGIDHCFAGFDGMAELRWPKSNLVVRMRASQAFSHLVLYSPPGKPFIALEPQTQMNDGFNYLARGETETGVVVLEAGQELAASFSLAVEATEER